jgi:predicted Rossmann-fold nucleotide-binding protein
MLRKLPIIGVFGQGTAIDAERARLAHAVGVMVARLGAHLLTGGGYGVMEAAAAGFVDIADRKGFSIGIIPCKANGPFDQPNRTFDGLIYPNSFVEIPVFTPLPSRPGDWRRLPTRNHINILTANAMVALPGNVGTRNELTMAAFYRQEQDRPADNRRTVLMGPIEEFTAEHRATFVHAESVADAERHLARVLAAQGFALHDEAVP